MNVHPILLILATVFLLTGLSAGQPAEEPVRKVAEVILEKSSTYVAPQR